MIKPVKIGKKGLLKTLEATIAILMMMTIVVTFYGPREELPQFKEINWKLRGFEAIYTLDQSNELRSYVLGNDTTTITRKLNALLPANLEYEVFVCGLDCGRPNATSEELVSVSYILAGDVDQFNPRRVVLYIW